jgi:uncharacterized SAM-binding protein YcdF (DUF218 family)
MNLSYFSVARYFNAFMPLGFACAGIALAILLSWTNRWASRLILLLVLAILGGLGCPQVSERVIAPLERAYPVPPDTVKAEAAVVLAGSMDLARSTPGRIEWFDRPERMIEGSLLAVRGRVNCLVLSGGVGDPNYPEKVEADLMAAFARTLGVDPGSIVLQRRSRTTHEDALYTAEILRERGIRSFFLVTSAFHMPRAVGCFRKQGLDPIPYPVDFRVTPEAKGALRFVPTAATLCSSTLALHEYIGYGVYWLLGYL